MTQTALISVSDKVDLIPFCKFLQAQNFRLLTTSGTQNHLKQAGIPSIQVSDITHFPEIMDGRLKSLHPIILGGILGQRHKHRHEAQKQGISWIDLVIVNLYPFEHIVATLKEKQKNFTKDTLHEKIIENIDIGGATLIRAAAKNYNWVTIITDPLDYPKIMEEIKLNQSISLEIRQKLAQKAFFYTAQYDAIITNYFQPDGLPEKPFLILQKNRSLRYGENPHQSAYAATLGDPFHVKNSLFSAKQHQGKSLSYNNLTDAHSALICVKEFSSPACVIVKHNNPCGVGTAKTIEKAWHYAFKANPTSAFGGIMAINRTCTKSLAQMLVQHFWEVIIAPCYSQEAIQVFAQKTNLRILEIPIRASTYPSYELHAIDGGILFQEKDIHRIKEEDLEVVTDRKPDPKLQMTLKFAWHVVKHVKSNAIVIAHSHQTIGIGAGQTSRIAAVNIALEQAFKQTQHSASSCVLASDGFFPFRDSIDCIAKAGIKTIIQPGGSLKDSEVIDACNQHHIAMILTGKRCFKH